MGKQIKKTVLVVDDEQDTTIFLFNLLHTGGFIPVVAENKTDGLKKAIDENPSVIIINMMMSGERGIQMYRNLKSDHRLKHIPIIMLSTLDQKTFFKCHMIRNDRLECKMPEPDILLEKPLETEELLSAVNKLIKIKRIDEISSSKHV